ncbi:ArsR family transcriptional regulator [Natronococcus sp. JC468]|uniref:DUF7344 domain-containing protein n=1 Tax=Natronococcus sp. JC468 TaxID=1961921 RepID=UPI00143B5F86|nr:ArsR family transcriptional regulator [Natronococcus sp. JC468]NKE35408.1 ArsR family transcriptional regulator [Natronococcus sp. JC468]
MDPREARILRLLTDATNRAVVSMLNGATEPIPATAIAERLVEREATPIPPAGEDLLERTLVSLHHDRLPRLEEAGLLEYDRDDRTVTGTGYIVAPEWDGIDALDELLSGFRVGSAADEGDVGILEGREDVAAYGRELIDGADDELFVLAAAAVLDDGFFQPASDALARGVDLRIGTEREAARTVLRNRLPEATVWEPHSHRPADPSSRPGVSRLVVADREAVVVGLSSGTADGAETELGLVGEGTANPLVVLVRELLGPRLDRPDHWGEAFPTTRSSDP